MGKLTVITGSMFSGKTEELIRIINRFIIAQKKVLVIKPEIDNRFDQSAVVSRNGHKINAVVSAGKIDLSILLNITSDYDVIAFDEAQFFDRNLIDLCLLLRMQGKTIIVAGLDLDRFGKPFGYMPELMAIADEVQKLTAVCFYCKEDKHCLSISTEDNKDIIMVGDDIYQPICWDCYLSEKHQKAKDRV